MRRSSSLATPLLPLDWDNPSCTASDIIHQLADRHAITTPDIDRKIVRIGELGIYNRRDLMALMARICESNKSGQSQSGSHPGADPDQILHLPDGLEPVCRVGNVLCIEPRLAQHRPLIDMLVDISQGLPDGFSINPVPGAVLDGLADGRE